MRRILMISTSIVMLLCVSSLLVKYVVLQDISKIIPLTISFLCGYFFLIYSKWNACLEDGNLNDYYMSKGNIILWFCIGIILVVLLTVNFIYTYNGMTYKDLVFLLMGFACGGGYFTVLFLLNLLRGIHKEMIEEMKEE